MIDGSNMMPVFQAALLQAEKFPVVVMSGVAKNEEKLEIIENIYTNVRLTSFQLSASSEIPTCSLSLAFDTVETSYYVINIPNSELITRLTSKYEIKSRRGYRSLVAKKSANPNSNSVFKPPKEARLNIKELTAQDLSSFEQLKIFSPDETPIPTVFPIQGVKLNVKIHKKDNIYREMKLKTPTRSALIELIASRTNEKKEDITAVYRTGQGIDIEIETDEHVNELGDEERIRYDTKNSVEDRKPEIK